MNVLSANDLVRMIDNMRRLLVENREKLIQLDSEMGDGDLGIYMASGMESAFKAVQELPEKKLPCDVFNAVARTFFREAPSTMGTLLSTAFMQAAKDMSDKEELDAQGLVAVYGSFVVGIERRGGAKLGDKTILDVLIPASTKATETMKAGGALSDIALSAYMQAKEGLETAKGLKAVYGRPAYFGDKTIGKYDGGTVVGMLLCQAIYETA